MNVGLRFEPSRFTREIPPVGALLRAVWLE
jgi:hypothetical protein